jgi:hypothetical protein
VAGLSFDTCASRALRKRMMAMAHHVVSDDGAVELLRAQTAWSYHGSWCRRAGASSAVVAG